MRGSAIRRLKTFAGTEMTKTKAESVAITGAGAIGAAWAIVFARAGFAVALHDVAEVQLSHAVGFIDARLLELEGFGLLGDAIKDVRARITLTCDLEQAVVSASLVIEAAPEQLTLKRAVFAKLDVLTEPDAILASSSSALTASLIAEGLSGQHRCLVAHPGNPPYLLPVVELVPAPFTDPAVTARAAALFDSASMAVVTLKKEVEGFVFNRLQGAILREAYCLVRDGVIGADALDSVVRNGLGMRYAFIGPFETSDLNVGGGITAHAERMGSAYHRMGLERGQDDPWTPELVETVNNERRAVLPLREREARLAWRDRRLMALARLKQTLAQDA